MNDFLILGLIILVGFIGRGIFRYTKVPDSLFMIIIGLIVGPFFNIVDQSELANYTPLVVTLTLIIVLLDSGLSLEIARALSILGFRTLYGLIFFKKFTVRYCNIYG